MSDTTWGGFIPSNIRNSIIKDCIESGDPLNMFRAIWDEIDRLVEDGAAELIEFWNKAATPESETK